MNLIGNLQIEDLSSLQVLFQSISVNLYVDKTQKKTIEQNIQQLYLFLLEEKVQRYHNLEFEKFQSKVLQEIKELLQDEYRNIWIKQLTSAKSIKIFMTLLSSKTPKDPRLLYFKSIALLKDIVGKTALEELVDQYLQGKIFVKGIISQVSQQFPWEHVSAQSTSQEFNSRQTLSEEKSNNQTNNERPSQTTALQEGIIDFNDPKFQATQQVYEVLYNSQPQIDQSNVKKHETTHPKFRQETSTNQKRNRNTTQDQRSKLRSNKSYEATNKAQIQGRQNISPNDSETYKTSDRNNNQILKSREGKSKMRRDSDPSYDDSGTAAKQDHDTNSYSNKKSRYTKDREKQTLNHHIRNGLDILFKNAESDSGAKKNDQQVNETSRNKDQQDQENKQDQHGKQDRTKDHNLVLQQRPKDLKVNNASQRQDGTEANRSKNLFVDLISQKSQDLETRSPAKKKAKFTGEQLQHQSIETLEQIKKGLNEVQMLRNAKRREDADVYNFNNEIQSGIQTRYQKSGQGKQEAPYGLPQRKQSYDLRQKSRNVKYDMSLSDDLNSSEDSQTRKAELPPRSKSAEHQYKQKMVPKSNLKSSVQRTRGESSEYAQQPAIQDEQVDGEGAQREIFKKELREQGQLQQDGQGQVGDQRQQEAKGRSPLGQQRPQERDMEVQSQTDDFDDMSDFDLVDAQRSGFGVKRYRTGRKNFWTKEETMFLEKSVAMVGRNWSLIIKQGQGIFHNRNQIDLKDKWRNLKKYGKMTQKPNELRSTIGNQRGKYDDVLGQFQMGRT